MPRMLTAVRRQQVASTGAVRRGARRLVACVALGAVAVGLAACGSSSSSTPAQTANANIAAGLKAEKAGNQAQAIKDFQAAIAANPADAIPYYDLGVIYQGNKDSNDAVAYYHKALLANPNYQPALFNLAIAYTPTDPTQAISLYNQLLAINPNDADVNFNLGLLLIAQNQATAGHAALKKAIAINPSLASRVPAGITP